MKLPFRSTPARRQRTRQAGYSLLEALITITIGVFILGGLVLIFSNTRQYYGNQNSLSQLQEQERVAMNILGTVVQHAGYYPAPPPAPGNQGAMDLSLGDTFLGDANDNYVAGQYLSGCSFASGTCGASVTTDVLAMRYFAGNTTSGSYQDTIQDCNGGTNTGTTNLEMRNALTVDTTQNALLCVTAKTGVNAALATALANHDPTTALINGVTGFTVLYGVDLRGSGSVGQYLPASGVTNWSNVISVRVQLTFANPITPTSPITFSRVIKLMNKT